jgi:hypothetical protein
LAIAPAYWIDRSASASAGRVVVTATAAPYEAIWEMGDGETVLCDGPGVVWQPGLDDGATDCAHTYRRSSAGASGSDSFELRSTVHFQVTAATNAPGNYGPFPDLERVTVQAVQVGEIQAVND